MRTRIASLSRRPLATALFVALIAPGVAFAETAKEKELEARVAQLEQQVQALLASQQQQQTVISETQAQVTEVKTVQAAEAARVPAGKQRIQAVSITPGAVPGSTFKVGGFIKVDFLATQTGDGQLADDATGRALYLPGQTPVGGERSGVDSNAHAKFSRFNLGVDSVTDSGDKMGAFVEMDFFGGALGNQAATNTYGVTLRHAYMYWNNWLAGQTWSNFMDVGSMPEAVDFVGPTDGVIFVRQAQLRYTKGAFSAALENSETSLVGTTSSDRGALPDLTLRYGWKGDWGTFGIGALARSLADLVVAVTGIAGPGGGRAAKPVGTVCFAWGRRGGAVERHGKEAPLDEAAVFRACSQFLADIAALFEVDAMEFLEIGFE